MNITSSEKYIGSKDALSIAKKGLRRIAEPSDEALRHYQRLSNDIARLLERRDYGENFANCLVGADDAFHKLAPPLQLKYENLHNAQHEIRVGYAVQLNYSMLSASLEGYMASPGKDDGILPCMCQVSAFQALNHYDGPACLTVRNLLRKGLAFTAAREGDGKKGEVVFSAMQMLLSLFGDRHAPVSEDFARRAVSLADDGALDKTDSFSYKLILLRWINAEMLQLFEKDDFELAESLGNAMSSLCFGLAPFDMGSVSEHLCLRAIIHERKGDIRGAVWLYRQFRLLAPEPLPEETESHIRCLETALQQYERHEDPFLYVNTKEKYLS